jgi:hypothetical protein
MRVSLLLLLVLALTGFPAAADLPALPEPDYAAIEAAAKRVTSGEEYAESLPARWAECNETARPYGESQALKHQIEFRQIRIVCLQMMLLKLGDLYYHPAGFGPEGLTHRFKQFRIRLYAFLKDMYTARADCAATGCGPAETSLLPRDAYLRLLIPLVERMALTEGRIAEYGSWRRAWKRAGAIPLPAIEFRESP